MLGPRNKYLVFVIAFSHALTLFLLLPLDFLLISIACTCVFSFVTLSTSFIPGGFSLSIKKAIEHLNSYLEKYKGEVLEHLIGNLVSPLGLRKMGRFFSRDLGEYQHTPLQLLTTREELQWAK